jgi:hypothetical protein
MCISVTKSGEHNTKFALPSMGLFFDLPWIIWQFPALVAKYGYRPVPLDAQRKRTLDIAHARYLSPTQFTDEESDAYSTLLLTAFCLSAEIDMSTCKLNHWTGHSPHATFMNLAESFCFNDKVCKSFPRHSQGTRDTYVTRPTCENQLTFRTFLINAFRAITGGVVPDIEGTSFITSARTKDNSLWFGHSAI